MSRECFFYLAYKVIVSTLLASTAFLSPLLNAFVCLTIFRTAKFRTTGNILIANLAISDALIGLSLSPLEIVYVACFPAWPIGHTGTNILNSIFLFSLVSPFVIISVITVERYKTIKASASGRLDNGISRCMLILIICGMWAYSFIAVAVLAANLTATDGKRYAWNVPPTFYYPFLGLHIVVPFFIVCKAYQKIFAITKATRKESLDSSTATQSLLQKRELKLAKTLRIVIGLMFLVWLPVLVIECFYATESASCVIEAIGPLNVWLTASNGIMNPIVYFYRNPSLRAAFYQAFKLRKPYASAQLLEKLND